MLSEMVEPASEGGAPGPARPSFLMWGSTWWEHGDHGLSIQRQPHSRLFMDVTLAPLPGDKQVGTRKFLRDFLHPAAVLMRSDYLP